MDPQHSGAAMSEQCISDLRGWLIVVAVTAIACGFIALVKRYRDPYRADFSEYTGRRSPDDNDT